MRVHELAKELGISSTDLVAKLRELGADAKSHMSSVDETALQLLREAKVVFPPKPAKPVAPAAPTAAAAPAHAAPAPAPAPAAPAAPVAPVAPVAAPVAAPAPAAASAPAAAPAPAAPAAEAAAPAVAKQLPETGLLVEGKVIHTRGAVVVKEFAEALRLRPAHLISELMAMNLFASLNERIDVAVAAKVAQKHGFTLEHHKRAVEHRPPPKRREDEDTEAASQPEDLVLRPPVVTFLGHVDHGKTSLLDRIRHTAVVDTEHGGITQHIGAYTVETRNRSITFLDTPGHEAFTAMRSRGANLTDIAVIIIAADDGVMPQTEEAIQHARAAEVSIMVAINKIDLPAANVDRVKQQLQKMDLSPEDWGGKIICCPVSAQTGAGIDHLLEMILLQADVLELKANPARRAKGYVVEARMEPGMGPMANLLVTEGTLKLGDAVYCDRYWGRVRALTNDHGIKVKSAGPSTPISCLGMSGVPGAGAEFRVCANDRAARALAETAEQKARTDKMTAPRRASLADLYEHLKDGDRLELKLILKADTQGSVEAILHALQSIRSEKVSLNTLLSGTGNITSNDVLLASASNAVIMGFHVSKEDGVDSLARREGVETHLHHIIYELIDQVTAAMKGLLPPKILERVMGRAQIQKVFPLGKTSMVAGCMVTEGQVTPRFRVRVKRADAVLHQGVIASLRHFQDEVSEVRQLQECGIRLENFTAFQVGDVLEFYQVEELEQTL